MRARPTRVPAVRDEPAKDAAADHARINGETARIGFAELQRFFAQGRVIAVEPDLDLVEVACQFHQDNTVQVRAWIAAAQVGPLDDGRAAAWLEAGQEVWSVVVRPWVLVQLPAASRAPAS